MIVIFTNIIRTPVCHSEPVLLKDKNTEQRIKGTLGITG
jgi:hypothetical protein